MPVTRVWMPSSTRAPPMAQPSQRAAIQYSGMPRFQSERRTMMMPQGITVTSIHSAWRTERMKAIRRPPASAACSSRASRKSTKAARSSCTCVSGGYSGGSGDAAAGRAHAGQQQVRLAAGGRAGLQVAQAVARRRHVGQVDAEALADLLEQARLGLAAIAALVGAVRAIEHRVDAAADGRQHLVHLGVHGVERRHVEQAAARGPTGWRRSPRASRHG